MVVGSPSASSWNIVPSALSLYLALTSARPSGTSTMPVVALIAFVVSRGRVTCRTYSVLFAASFRSASVMVTSELSKAIFVSDVILPLLTATEAFSPLTSV